MIFMPETLKDCRCIDKEDRKILISALDDAIGYNAYRIRKEKESPEGRPETIKRLTIRKRAFDELREIIKNTSECK